jgi:hypothetical protein
MQLKAPSLLFLLASCVPASPAQVPSASSALEQGIRHRARQRLLRFPTLVKSHGELQRRHAVIRIQSQDLPG